MSESLDEIALKVEVFGNLHTATAIMLESGFHSVKIFVPNFSIDCGVRR